MSSTPYVADRCRIREDHYRFGEQEVRVTARFNQPTIVILDNFLSIEECCALIELARPNLKPSLEYDRKSDSVRVARQNGRISETAFFLRENEDDPLIGEIETRISLLLGIHGNRGEGMSVTRYGPGGFVGPHRDYLEIKDLPEDSPTTQGGYRICTLLIYLSNVSEGGQTYFHGPGVEIRPRMGRAVYFEYCNRAGQVDRSTTHEALPVKLGEKWIVTKWFRQHAFTPASRPIRE